jgi:hypothetical protein
MRLAHLYVTRVSFFLGAALLAFAVQPAAAQGPGIRAGVSVDPDQFYFGGHYETDALVDRLHFRPNVEIGVGDDLTTVALNFEFAYKFERQGDWGFYAGGGPAVNFYDFDGGNDTEPGLNFLVGAETRQGLFFEFKIGTVDSPDLKFGVGWRFGG